MTRTIYFLLLFCIPFTTLLAQTETNTITEESETTQVPKRRTITVRGDGPSKPDIFAVVEVMPLFPYDEADCNENARACSDEAIMAFIYDNLEYPPLPENANEMAVVSFVVGENGRMRNIQLALDPGQSCGEKALEVMQLMQNNITWTPGNHRGQNVAVRYNVPITFKNNTE